MQQIQNWIARRVEQWRRASAMVGLLIHGSTLSLVTYGALRGAPWWIVPLLFAGIMAGALALSWAYYGVLQMRVAEQRARFDLDVRDQTMLSPKEAKLIAILARGMRGDASAWEELQEAADAQQIN